MITPIRGLQRTLPCCSPPRTIGRVKQARRKRSDAPATPTERRQSAGKGKGGTA